MRLLCVGRDEFITGARHTFSADLQTAAWVARDDTVARRDGMNGVCTQIDNDDCTGFGAATSKVRPNILDPLRAGHSDCVVTSAALAHMRDHSRARTNIARFVGCPDRQSGSVVGAFRPAGPTYCHA